MRTILTLIIYLSLSSFSNDYQEAIEALQNNDLTESIDKFKSAIKSGDNAEKASLYYVFLKQYQLESMEENYNIIKNNVEKPEYILNAFWQRFYGQAYGHSTADFVDDLADDELENIKYSRLRDNLIETISNSKKSIAEYDDWQEYKNKIQNIKDWQIVGVFENISGMGFDMDYAPINYPEPNSVFKNKYNADVKWFPAKGYGRGEWIRFWYYFNVKNSIVFAQTFVRSDSNMTVQANLGVSGSVKMWTNDQLNYKEEEELNNGQNSYIFEIKLKKGWNRLLLQMGASENTSSNFFLTLTDFDGNYLQNVSYSNEFHQYEKVGGENIKTIENPHLTYLKEKVAENPDDIAYDLALLTNAYYTSNFDQMNQVREKIKILFPASLISYLVDRDYYAMKDNATLFKKTIEEIRKMTDKFPPALEYLWSEENENQNIQELKKLYKKMKDQPKYFSKATLLQKQMIIDIQNGDYQEAFKKAFEGYEDYPNSVDFLSIVLSYYIEGTKQHELAIGALEDYLDENYNLELLIALSSFHINYGDFDDGVEVLEDNQELFPYSTKIYEQLSDIYYGQNQYKEAAKYMKKCLEFAPYYSYFYQSLANIYQQDGNKSAAKENYQKAIDYYPLNYDSRRKLTLLDNKKSLFKRMGEPNLDSIYNNTETPQDENISVLHNEVKSIAYENGGFEQKHYMLYKALNSQGVDMLKEYSISGYGNQRFSIEEAKLIKPDGSQIEAEENGTYLVFPGMEVGDAIKVVYQQWTYNGYTLTNHFWDTFYMGFGYPGVTSKYTLALEGDKEFNYQLVNNDTLKPVTSKIDKFKTYTWELKNIKEFKSESYMPELADVASVLYVSSIPDWKFIVDWYTGLTKNRIKEDESVTRKLNELVSEDLAPIEKVKKAYNYILEDIRYSSVSFRQSGYIPQKSKKLIDERLGDCKDLSTLLVNFCNEIGVDANLVLVKTRDNGMNSLALPSVNFNHCAVEINHAGKKYFVETTNEHLSFGNISENMIDQQILPIKTETTSIESLKGDISTVPNKVHRDTKINIGMVESLVEKLSKKYGGRASGMRSSYKYLNEEEKYEAMEKAIIDGDPSLELKELNFITGLDEVTDSIVYEYKYTMPSNLLEVGDMLVYNLEWTDKFYSTDVVASKKRDTPIELYKYTNTEIETEEVELILPENYIASELPDNVIISNDLFEYKQEFKSGQSKIYCKRYFKFKKRLIEPQEYSKFKKGIEQIVKADKTNIVLKQAK
jgi:tetratricopeptide (TPR) repeat protein